MTQFVITNMDDWFTKLCDTTFLQQSPTYFKLVKKAVTKTRNIHFLCEIKKICSNFGIKMWALYELHPS